jgi:hypothetical protein
MASERLNAVQIVGPSSLGPRYPIKPLNAVTMRNLSKKLSKVLAKHEKAEGKRFEKREPKHSERKEAKKLLKRK